MRVAVVGPAPPDRGGIARETRLLAANLRSDLAGYFSFSRRYPRFLDPRRFDVFDSESESVPAATPLFDYSNPASWRRTAAAIVASGADAVIVPWWTSFWAIPVRALFRRLRKSHPGLVRVLLCHNVTEHESSRLQRWLCFGAFEAADRFIVHSPDDAAALAKLFPAKHTLTLAHPVAIGMRVNREESRRKLRVTSPLVLFLGLVRQYKGVELLVSAAPAIAQATGAEVAVVGETFEDARASIDRCRSLPAGRGIRWIDRYVTEEEMDEWLAASDVVVCPYRHVSGSGIVARAIAAGRPVVASDLPGFRMLLSESTGAFFPPGDSTALAPAVISVLRRGVESYAAALSQVAERFSWQLYTAELRRFCAGEKDQKDS